MKIVNKKDKRYLVRNVFIFLLLYGVLASISIFINKDSVTPNNILTILVSLFLIVASSLFYIYYSEDEMVMSGRKMIAFCVILVLSFAVCVICEKLLGYFEVAPLALCSLLLSLTVTKKSSFFGSFAVIIAYLFQTVNFQTGEIVFTDQIMYLLFAGITTNIIASYVFSKSFRRIVYVFLGVVLGIVSAGCRVVTYALLHQSLEDMDLLSIVSLPLASGLICIALTFVLLPILEFLFNIDSPFRFSEIAGTNTELMRLLYQKAPGTFNHCLTVANYVEACASAIGEDPFLARAVAYYHDVGKIKNPSYFSENQGDGANPHDQLTPEASVAIIRSHALNGLAIAKQYKLPIDIQRAIVEHHGTMPLKFFYLKAKKYVDGDLPYDDYSYAGPKPSTKISAILMICDACEAALRASGNKENAEKIVDGIVEERMNFDQFSDCDITMREIETIKNTVCAVFLGIKHDRVKYPDKKLEEK